MELYLQRYEEWKNDAFYDEATRQELANIKENDQEIKERFFQFLEVGTGGLRGILGAGTNRMNIYTVSHITEGLARFIEEEGEEAKKAGVCISYDSRHQSQIFAEQAALVLAYHGIRSYVYPSLHPTPMLSYAVRYYKAKAGIMVTASHNPAKYNGYKMYGEDGGQMPPESADKVIYHTRSIKDLRSLKWLNKEEAIKKGLFQYIGKEVDEAYYKMALELSISHEVVKEQKDLAIVYTPLHGAGSVPVCDLLSRLGFENIAVVEEQRLPDPDFSTVDYPNPEERSALELAIHLAKEKKADLVLATDPDADRLGAVIRLADGEYKVLSGNQIALLLMDYVLSAKKKKNSLPEKSFVCTTIVSTRLAHRIAEAYQVKLYEVLTGFKYIGEKIKKLDEFGDESYQFGFEESYGYLVGTAVRDKDAVTAAMLFAELAAVCASQGKNLHEKLEELYRKYGYASEKTISITLEGLEGMQKIQDALAHLRTRQYHLGKELPVLRLRDYQKSISLTLQEDETWKEETLCLPKSNVLLYDLPHQTWLAIRPSGTEPKIKVYIGSYAQDPEQAEKYRDQYLSAFETCVREALA